jgi:hypothetical protein
MTKDLNYYHGINIDLENLFSEMIKEIRKNKIEKIFN